MLVLRESIDRVIFQSKSKGSELKLVNMFYFFILKGYKRDRMGLDLGIQFN